MRYQKPVVMDLGSRTRRAQGQGPLACISGSVVGGYESCGTGYTAGMGCGAGNVVWYGDPPCVGGGSAGHANCFAGTDVAWDCGAGTGGEKDPYGCRSGPTP